MQFLAELSNTGWIVIAFIAVLAFILVFFALRKGTKFRIGDKEMVVGDVGKEVDNRLAAFKGEIEQREKNRQKDEELRKQLFRAAVEIDEKIKADNRRVIRKLTPAIQDIFKPFGGCEFAVINAVEIIRDELTERIDYNCIRERLSVTEKQGYIADILHHIKIGYETFLLKTSRLLCSIDTYPVWRDIRPAVEVLINTWAAETIAVLKKRLNEKIEIYTAERENFLLPENRDNAVDFPVKKNKQYIKKLGG